VGRVQRRRKRNGAWRGRDGARQCRAMVSWCRGLDAVCVLVLSRAGQGTDARERDARAGRSGWPNGVALTRSGRGLRPGSCRTDSGNWFLVSSWAWRRGDCTGGGRWRAGSAGVASVGRAMAGLCRVRGLCLCSEGPG
jgi:hypothetical protein